MWEHAGVNVPSKVQIELVFWRYAGQRILDGFSGNFFDFLGITVDEASRNFPSAEIIRRQVLA